MNKCDDHIVGHTLNDGGLWGILFNDSERNLYCINDDEYVEFNFCPDCGENIRKSDKKMTHWIKWSDQLPPLGKKVITTRPGSNSLGITTLMFTLNHEEDSERFLGGGTEEMLKACPGYWFEIPEPPEEK